MESIYELGGFAEDLEDIDGTEEEFNAFNYCLAECYVCAMYREDFEQLGEFSAGLLEKICYWYDYTETLGNKDEVQKIRSGELITNKNRTFIDAIYENKSATLAETYLLKGIYSPKLALTIILSDEDEYEAYIICSNQEEFDDKIKQLYDFIENEYNRYDNKEEFLNKIKNNYNRLRVPKNRISKPVPNTYSWVKQLKKLNK